MGTLVELCTWDVGDAKGGIICLGKGIARAKVVYALL